jgi:flavin-dependent dehydrogenase
MNNPINRIVVVGGGTAGWLTAGIIAAEHRISKSTNHHPFELILIESPDISTIGVGEGTWPSMRSTLQKVGISETDLLTNCDASFKQGTFFKNWTTGKGDTYAHPFTAPHRYADTNLAPHWLALAERPCFSEAVCPQPQLFSKQLAPKQITTPEYAFNVNYGYHLNATNLAALLKRHCINVLGVEHIQATVTEINSADNGDIESISTDRAGTIDGNLFIDCTGSKALLLGKHYGIALQNKSHILFNNSALATQVPYPTDDAPIESCTLSTAQEAGWIWDIGLPSRRGVGHVYSAEHISEEQASNALINYIESITTASKSKQVSLRKLTFEPGHREKFWHRNCVAIGMSAGFIEPLEASALVLVELSASMIAEQLPATRSIMDLVANRFNKRFLFRWERIIEFLKLHYVLNKKTTLPYWADNLAPSSVPDSLQESLALWRHISPWHYDSHHVDDLFPSASFQYVLYGMGFETINSHTKRNTEQDAANLAATLFKENIAKSAQLTSALPTNRELINKINTFGLQKI